LVELFALDIVPIGIQNMMLEKVVPRLVTPSIFLIEDIMSLAREEVYMPFIDDGRARSITPFVIILGNPLAVVNVSFPAEHELY
jgi:hypothetical protein